MTVRSRFLFLGSIFAALGVAAGAFGAHGLRNLLDSNSLGIYETAVRYQMYHAFGLFIVAGLEQACPKIRAATVGWLFVAGILLFSGSLYVLALSHIKWFGAITPLGGLSFIVGWLTLAWRAITSAPSELDQEHKH